MLHKRLMGVLISILITVSGVEALLRIADPLGVVYSDDYAMMRRNADPAPHGYTLRTGQYNAAKWSYRVNIDGSRNTPGRVPHETQVVFIGDSVTFGYGVNDDEVWVSLVASRLALDANNAGRTSYSAANAAALLRDIEGCVVFLTFPNDPSPGVSSSFANDTIYDERSFTDRTGALLRYGKPTVMPEPFNPAFEAAMTEIAARLDTLILAFDDSYGRAVADAYGAVLIPWYTDRVSFADAHASAVGNRQIADAAAPIIADWLRGRYC
jgi:hypothetical protein